MEAVAENPTDIDDGATVVERVLDLRKGSDYRASLDTKVFDDQYGVVSFPRSGHNWLSRMIAEIVKLHCCHTTPSAIGKIGGMGHYLGLKSHRPDQVERMRQFFDPFPAIYGSHGHKFHDGFEPNTQLYLWRGFRAVWKSTKKTMKDMESARLAHIERVKEAIEEHECELDRNLQWHRKLASLKASLKVRNGPWWGGNRLDCFLMWLHHRWRFRKAPLKIRYEDLVKDTHGTLRKICDHMGVTDVSVDVIEAAVRAGSRENMLREQELYESPNPFQTVNEAS